MATRGLSRRFDRRYVVSALSITLARGEILALAGPNGSGKSTVLRLLSGLLSPTSGDVAICGHDLRTDLQSARRCLGVSFGEDRSWYWRLTGRQNLDFFARLRGAAVRDDALAEVGLEGVATPVGQWSSGMRSRLGLARALLGDPPVLLLDEPGRALDAEGAVVLRRVVEGRRDSGAAIVLATHDPAQVAAATNVIILP